MLARARRLTNSRLITKIFRSGTWLTAGAIGAKYLPTYPGIPAQATFVVSKKVSKLSVDRNKFKRQMRGAFKKLLDNPATYPNLNRFHIIFTAQRLPSPWDYVTIEKSMIDLCRRVGQK